MSEDVEIEEKDLEKHLVALEIMVEAGVMPLEEALESAYRLGIAVVVKDMEEAYEKARKEIDGGYLN